MTNAMFFPYVLTMAGVTYLIRMLPFVFLKRELKSPLLRSFFFYIPYAVLGAMTFSAVFYATGDVTTSMVGCVVAFLLGYLGKNLGFVSLAASIAAYVAMILF